MSPKAKKTTPAASKRHANRKPESLGFTMPALKRLASRGGVKRTKREIKDLSNHLVGAFMAPIVRDTLVFVLDKKRMTILPSDVYEATKRRSKAVIGYGI
jgi:histone H3/H4